MPHTYCVGGGGGGGGGADSSYGPYLQVRGLQHFVLHAKYGLKNHASIYHINAFSYFHGT